MSTRGVEFRKAVILALVLTTACWEAVAETPQRVASGKAENSRSAATAQRAPVAPSGAPAAVKADPEQSQEIQVLKQILAAQQQQIEQLRVALQEQRQLIEQALKPGEQVANSTPTLGVVASVNPVIPAKSSAGALPPRAAPMPQNAGSSDATQADLDVVKGELEAVAESANQTNQRLAKLEGDMKSAPALAGWTGSHPYIQSKDGNHRVELGGQLQLDYRAYSGTASPPSTFAIRRARLEMAGVLFKHLEYKIQGDFADGASTLLRDGYVNVNYHKAAQFQFGHFKAPFSQEELQSSKHLDFVERSSVSALAPARSPGMMFHGKLLDGAFEYYAGAFNARRDLLLNTASTPEGYVRLRFTPFKGFSFGGAFADGRHRNDNSFAGRTASRSFTFFSATPVNGEIVRANGEFWWNFKNFSLRGEYNQTHQSREGLGPGGSKLTGVIGKGLVVQTTYLLTGEEKGENGVTPKMNFLDGQRGRGAWELAFRYENLQMHDSARANRAEAFTMGVNWWLTKFVRYQSNIMLERFKDPLRAPTPGDQDHLGYLSRIQVIF